MKPHCLCLNSMLQFCFYPVIPHLAVKLPLFVVAVSLRKCYSSRVEHRYLCQQKLWFAVIVRAHSSGTVEEQGVTDILQGSPLPPPRPHSLLGAALLAQGSLAPSPLPAGGSFVGIGVTCPVPTPCWALLCWHRGPLPCSHSLPCRWPPGPVLPFSLCHTSAPLSQKWLCCCSRVE